MARAARNSFLAAMLSLWALGMAALFRPDITFGASAMLGFATVLWLVFSANLAYYERRGD